MLHKTIEKPQGYEYPDPSIEGGQTQPPNHRTPKPLSGEDADKLRKSVQGDTPGKKDRDR
ncbi:MAG: hypothetical protein ACHQ50_18295 [Fimbriimonadales bacterium]